MFSAKVLTSVLLSLGALQTASAAPKNLVYPEVIPGPGMPSLESLNLTSQMLYEMPAPIMLDGDMKARFAARCGPDEGAYTEAGGINNIIACYHYINNRGGNCGSGPKERPVQMCASGKAHVTGASVLSSGTQSSCQHVARGILWSIDSCTRADGSVAGYAPAYGNGDFIVGATHVRRL